MCKPLFSSRQRANFFEPLNYGVANHVEGRKQHHLHETEKRGIRKIIKHTWDKKAARSTTHRGKHSGWFLMAHPAIIMMLHEMLGIDLLGLASAKNRLGKSIFLTCCVVPRILCWSNFSHALIFYLIKINQFSVYQMICNTKVWVLRNLWKYYKYSLPGNQSAE